MGIYDRISELCKNKGITIMKLEQELGFSNGSIGKLKKGGTIRADRLARIADYFGIATSVLLGREDDYDSQLGAPCDALLSELSALISNDPNYIVLLELITEIEPKDVLRITQIIRLVCKYE